MSPERRAGLDRDAGGDHDEENGLCYLQVLIADHIGRFGRARMLDDMDEWGYTFRLGSARAWFERDAADAESWPRRHDLIAAQGAPTWRTRSQGANQRLPVESAGARDANDGSGRYSMIQPFRNWLTTLTALPLAACSGASFFAANLPATFERYAAVPDLAYGESARQRLDVYTPKSTSAEPRPVIVFFHGGRWSFGEKEQYKFVGAALAARGCVAVLPNYRLYPQAKLAEFGDDAARAVAWASAHAAQFGGDPRRVFVMGHSAGAHLAVLIALDPHYLRDRGMDANQLSGVIGLAGPYDFLPFTEDDIRDMFGPPEKYPLSQPIEFARAGAPPMLLMHGTRDDTVWIKNSRNLAAALERAGSPVAQRYYDGIGHGDLVGALSIPLRRSAPVLDDLVSFIASIAP